MKGGGSRRSTRWRNLWLLGFASAVTVVLVVRLVVIQVAHAASLQTYASSFQTKKKVLPAPRGEIVDRNGEVLAMDVPRDQVVAAPRYIKHPNREAKALARVLPFSRHALASVLSNKSWYALLDSGVSPGTAAHIDGLHLTGISTVPVTGRTYPDGRLASQVIGMVGNQNQGLAGIEYEDNKVLAGKPGSWVVNVDALGNPLPQWQKAYTPAVPGKTIQLTIDSNIETVAQKWLKWGIKRVHATNGTVIIMNVHTGAVVALANWPNFNPNNYAKATPLEMSDYAVQDPFPPGSIFKPVTAGAALTLGLFTPQSLFDTRGYKMVDGVRINDWRPGGWGWISLTRGLEVSSDQVFMDVALKVGAQALYHFVHLFGFDHPSGVGLPGDSSGVWLKENQVNAVDLATIGFGQGFAATPMQLIAADNAIANDGKMVKPHIVRALLNASGQTVKKTPVTVESTPVSESVALEIQHMMTLEATKGTGVPAQVPGYIIAGKTGTAQKIVHGQTSHSQFVSSYLGYGPMPNPSFIMLVAINHPVGNLFYGDQVAAPVWQKIATFLFRYWKIKPYATGDNGSLPGTPVH